MLRCVSMDAGRNLWWDRWSSVVQKRPSYGLWMLVLVILHHLQGKENRHPPSSCAQMGFSEHRVHLYLQQAVHRCVTCRVGGIGLCSVLQEDFYDPRAAVGAGVVKRCVLLPAGGSGVGSCTEQLLDHPEEPPGLRRPLCSGARGIQGGLPLSVGGRNVRAVAEEELHVPLQASAGSRVQRCESGLPHPHVDVCASFQQQLSTASKQEGLFQTLTTSNCLL